MSTLLLSHFASLGHDMGAGHPERPDRIRALEKVLAGEEFNALRRETSPPGATSAILRVHPQAYVSALEEAAPHMGYTRLDADTVMNPGTWDAVIHAVGGATRAVDAVMTGEVENAFAMHRPPGHHAETATPMGFCFFNNAAVAARHAQAVHGASRVAIMDFDVHHGNGTQEIFWADPTVLYTSTHEMPLYPGTGARGETGDSNTIVNAPLTAGDGGDAFREAMSSVILPRIDAFAPDLIIISAGFDAHRRDPLANLQLVEDDYAWATGKLLDLAQKHAHGRCVSLLEGGYDLQGMSLSAAAHLRTMMGR